jgi:hypothetical protein
METEGLPVVIFSRQRWDAGGRAFQLSTRFAKERLVVLLEQPANAEPGVPDSWDLEFPMRQLLVGRPLLTRATAAAVSDRLPAMVRQLLRWQDVGEWIAWLDAPSAFTLARELAPRLVVYDCARPSLPVGADAGPSETELLRAADLLFLGDAVAEPLSWDGLAGHMLGELARAERGGLPPLRATQGEAAALLA